MKVKMTKSPAKHSPAKAEAKTQHKSKAGNGLMDKLKGALGKKPAAPSRPAAKAAASAKPAAKPSAPAKAAAKPAAASPPPAQKVVSNPTPPPRKPVSAARKLSNFEGLLTEDQIRGMADDEYMNDSQLDFFRQRLMQMRAEVLEREVDVKERLHQREVFADPADRATAEEEHWLDLRLRERESLLLRKIDDALRRIENREYGYCEKTGDPIGIPRLLARPTATVCVDVKGQDERFEAQFRDR